MKTTINSFIGISSMLIFMNANASTVSIDSYDVVGSSVSTSVMAHFGDVASGTSGGGFRVSWDTNTMTLNEGASGVSDSIQDIIIGQLLSTGDAGFSFMRLNSVNGSGIQSLDFAFTMCPLSSPCDTLSEFAVYDLTFDIVDPDITTVDLAMDGFFDPWFASDGINTISDVVYKGGTLDLSAAASPVPVPAAAWLFGSGLLGLVGVARRKPIAA